MKIPVLIANDTVADGAGRPGGKISLIEQETFVILHGRGLGRRPTDDEIANVGLWADPADQAAAVAPAAPAAEPRPAVRSSDAD